MKPSALLPCLIGGGIAALLLALFIGAAPISPFAAIKALFGVGSPSDLIVVWEIRLPRALAAYCVGAALGISGAALQGLLRNPLAEPGVLGVSATASLAATAILYWGLARQFEFIMPIASIIGALAATALIGFAAIRSASVVSLILIGAALSSFAGALMSLLMNTATDLFSLSDMVDWMLGSVANRSLGDLALSGPFMAAGALILLSQARGLSALTLGEEAAQGAGLDLQRTRLFVTLGAGLAVGGAVSMAGIIGFVGIVAPHMVRPLVRHDPARTLIPAALLGAIMLTLSDLLIRLIPTATELKLGVVAALAGAPVFAWIAAKRRPADG
ncbi:MAG: iron ABC transporter permease [Caulobacterales bacterium]